MKRRRGWEGGWEEPGKIAQPKTEIARLSGGRRAGTLGRRLAAIRYFHRAAGYDTPTDDEKVKVVLSGIRRTIGAAPVPKRAATSDMVIAMSATGTSLRALRDLPSGAASARV
jgi:hypothetical protein